MSNQELSIDQETQVFELVQRQAKLLATSTLVPKEFQGNMANCAIGLNIAKRLGADPFMVLQNIDVIHGRPSFRATFLIAMVNASGRFSPLQFKMEGEGQTRSCIAFATTKDDGKRVEGPEITMAMAKAEGWSTKAGSKWLTMPELMLRYRAAAFFARIYAPDITLGMQTSEESADAPAEPRRASGRVVETPKENPYGESIQTIIPNGELVIGTDEGPVSLPDDAERFALIDELREKIRSAEITTATFEAKARVAKVIKRGLGEATMEELQIIADNFDAIVAGKYGEVAK